MMHEKAIAEVSGRKEFLQPARDRLLEIAGGDRARIAWPIIRERLDGARMQSLFEKYSAYRVVPILRDAGLPQNRGLFDRGRAVTHADAFALRVALGLSTAEFQSRTGIAYASNPSCAMRPEKARTCIDLRNFAAAKLLADDACAFPSVARLLFPHLKQEYEMLEKVVPVAGRFILLHRIVADASTEEDIAHFAIEQARQETAGERRTSHFTYFLHWLPGLVGWIVRNQARFIFADENIALDLLAHTCASWSRVIQVALQPTNRQAVKSILPENFQL